MPIIAFLLSLLISLGLVPLIRILSNKFGLVASPRADRWHTRPTPKVGGIGIFLAWGISFSLFTIFSPFEIHNWPLLAGSGLIFLLGVIDDIKPISPPAKLVGEMIASAIVVFYGRNIDFFSDEFLNILVTFLWLVGITNAINLLDNMDGLAGGISFIAASLLSFLFWKAGSTDLLVISLTLAGGILGFLVFNFPPASIFMGDSGALFIGFTLSALAIARVPQASHLLSVMGVPTLLFLLPILDTTLVTVTRILRGQSPTRGGRDHTSHRLIAFGLSERQVVLTLYMVTIISGIFGVVIESINYTISLILIPIFLISLALLTAYLGRLKIIPPGSTTPGQRSIASLMINLTYRGRILEIALDLFLISIAYYLAFWIHYGTMVDILSLDIFINSLPIALGGTYICFFFFGIYRGVWQLLDIRDLLRYGRAVLGGVLLTTGVMSWIYFPLEISLRIFIIYTIILYLALVVSRSSFTILDRVYTQQTRNAQQEIPILIYGAGDEGLMLLQWLSRDTTNHLKTIGFLDNDPYKLGRHIFGIPVLGTIADLEIVLKRNEIEGILISSESALLPKHFAEVRDTCQKLGVWVKRPRIEFDEIDG